MLDKPEGSEFWRGRAREARALADGLATEATRRQMLAVAENFERLADESEADEERVSRKKVANAKPSKRKKSET